MKVADWKNSSFSPATLYLSCLWASAACLLRSSSATRLASTSCRRRSSSATRWASASFYCVLPPLLVWLRLLVGDALPQLPVGLRLLVGDVLPRCLSGFGFLLLRSSSATRLASTSCRRRSSSATRWASASWRSCGDNHGCCNALQMFSQSFSTRSATSVDNGSRCRKFCHCSYSRLPIIANNGSSRRLSPINAGTGIYRTGNTRLLRSSSFSRARNVSNSNLQ